MGQLPRRFGIPAGSVRGTVVSKWEVQVEELHLTYALAGALAFLLALISRPIRNMPVSEPMLGLLLGVTLGPQVLGLLELSTEVRDVVLLEGSRLLVAASVMAAALRFPASHLNYLVRPLLVLLVVVMPVAALVSGTAALLLGLPVALAALIGACLCPTDPVLAGSVVSGKPAQRDLPARLRHLLSVESGINDGLALPLVGLALSTVLVTSQPAQALGRLTWEVVGGVLIGAVAGAAAGWLVNLAGRYRELDPAPNLVLTLLLAGSVLGLGRMANTDGLLAVFVAGTVYNRLVTGEQREPQEGVDEAVNRYAVVPLFLVLGASLPWRDWAALGPWALAFVLVVLIARRLPAVLALSQPLGLQLRDATFLGWFGPMGVSSVYYLAHSLDRGVSEPRFFAAGSLVVAVSVLAYGLTSSPGRTLYARSRGREPAPS